MQPSAHMSTPGVAGSLASTSGETYLRGEGERRDGA